MSLLLLVLTPSASAVLTSSIFQFVTEQALSRQYRHYGGRLLSLVLYRRAAFQGTLRPLCDDSSHVTPNELRQHEKEAGPFGV